MKKLLSICTFLIIILVSTSSFAQDIIILRSGDQIKSKVLEVTPDLIKYKNWTNLDGPLYSIKNTDLSSIKYANGSKDDFNNSPTPQTSQSNNSSQTKIVTGKYIGFWYPENYDGINNRTQLIISKQNESYLVEYKVYTKVDQNFHSTDGSFKEVGQLEKGSIVVNAFIKLSLTDDTTILMNSKEFYSIDRLIRNAEYNVSTSLGQLVLQSTYVESAKQRLNDLAVNIRRCSSCTAEQISILNQQMKGAQNRLAVEETKYQEYEKASLKAHGKLTFLNSLR